MITRLRIGIALITLSAVSLTSTTAEARSFLWRISKKGQPTSYLLGSIHLGNKGFYPLAKTITNAFAKSKVLVLEARTDQMAKAAPMIMQKGMLMPPDSLKNHVSKKTYQLAVKKGIELGLPQAAIDHMRPWLLGLTFSAKELQRSGYDPKLGIEAVLMKRRGNRRVDVVEGAMFQINLLAGFTAKEQEFFLLYSIEQAKQAARLMAKMVKAWKRGDTADLARQMTVAIRKAPELRDVYKRLVTDRNVTMSQTMDKMLKKAKASHFFVIGAGHLVGKKSIPKLLQRMGYTIQQK